MEIDHATENKLIQGVNWISKWKFMCLFFWSKTNILAWYTDFGENL